METTPRARGALTHAVAAQIRAERAAADLTQTEVAERAGLARSVYIRIEKAQRDIDMAQLAAIAPVFSLTVSQVIERAEGRLVAPAAHTAQPAPLGSGVRPARRSH